MYITTTMCDGVLHCLLFLVFFWCPYMAINVNVSTRFGEGGGQLDRRRARGGLNPCARESQA